MADVNAAMKERGLQLRQGTIVDATLIAAPSSTKNDQAKSMAEMRQTKKGHQCHVGTTRLMPRTSWSMGLVTVASELCGNSAPWRLHEVLSLWRETLEAAAIQ